MSSFLTSGLGTSGGEVFQAEGGVFRLAEAGLPNPNGGLSRLLPLWSVLGGQAGREEELMTEHLPRLGPTGSPGQVRQRVEPLSAFCGGWDLVLNFHAGPQRGGTRSCQGQGEHYKGALRVPPATQLGGPHRVHPSYCHRRLRAVPQDTPELPPPFFSQELQEPGGEGRGLRLVS